MPRKKGRKSIVEKKPKLPFVRSPVFGPGCPVSPVLGALNPLTAKTVAVDELDVTWVSPNFQDLARLTSVGSRLRPLRGQRPTTRQRHQTGDKENNPNHLKVSGKFKPLMFVVEKFENDSLSLLKSVTPPRDTSCDHPPSPTGEVDTPDFKENQDKRCLEFDENSSPKGNPFQKVFDNVQQKTDLRNSPLRILNFSCEENHDLEHSLLRRSSRLKEKYLESVRLFKTPPRNQHRAKETVLVSDTPESDYGLRFRKRQLASLKRKIPVPTS